MNLADIDGPLLRGGAFDRRGPEDGVDFSILDDLALRLGSFGGNLLHLDFRGLPRIEDEFSEITSVHQLEVASGENGGPRCDDLYHREKLLLDPLGWVAAALDA